MNRGKSTQILIALLFVSTSSCCPAAASWPSLSAEPYDRAVATVAPSDHCIKELSMHNNKDPSRGDFLFRDRQRRFGSLEPDREWLDLESEVRQRHLQHDPNVRWLAEIAAPGNTRNSLWAREKIRIILEAERIQDMRTGDVFRPLAPRELLVQGDLHLCNQVDGVPWMIPANALTRGMLLTGPQGGGKTRLLIWICNQLRYRNIPYFILDPKQELKDWADYLGASYVTVNDISIDLSPPPGLTYEQWLRSLMPQLGDILAVIYGIEILQEAATISIDQREKYVKEAGQNTELCLNDLYLAVPFVTDVSRGRRVGYRDAVSTGLSRILTGSGNLFRCRKGIDLARIFFNRNTILGCRSITDEFAAKFLSLYLLYWLYEAERFSSPTDTLKKVLVLDDATQYLQKRPGFDAASSTSSFTHIFARLRSSGAGVIATTQIPHLADPGILALSHTVLCVGGLHYGEDTKLLAQMLSLSEEQRRAIPHLRKREVIGICAGSAWPRVVHGSTVEVLNSGKDAHV